MCNIVEVEYSGKSDAYNSWPISHHCWRTIVGNVHIIEYSGKSDAQQLTATIVDRYHASLQP